MIRLLLFLLGLASLSWGQEDIIEPGGPWRPPPPPSTTQRPPVPANYWITYSRTVRPGYPLIFNVQILKGTSPVDVTISLEDVEGNVVLSKGPVSVPSGVPQDIQIFVPLDVKKPEEKKNRWGYSRTSYTVNIIGVGSELSFNETDSATYTEKAFSIFVQTDKAMYKPSQSVKFRTLAMTPDMKVLRDVGQDIIVKDSKGNRILQYRNVTASKTLGVVEKSFNLASSVPAGVWIIEVTIMDTKYEKTFEVADYVLPRFEVKVEGSLYALVSDPLYKFSVSAIFTFGKPVTDGTVIVTIDMNYNWKKIPPIMKRGQLDKDGKFNVEVTKNEFETLIKKVYKYNMLNEQTFVITANVTETRTGKTYTGTHEFTFHLSPFDMDIRSITPSVFKSGLDFTAYIEVTKRDETPLSAEEVKNLKVHIEGTYNIPGVKPTTTTTVSPPPQENGTVVDEKALLIPDRYYDRLYVPPITKNLTLDNNEFNVPVTGYLVVTFRVPDDATSMSLQAKTMSEVYETERDSFYANKMYSPTNSFLQLSVMTQKIKVGETVKVLSKATDEFKELNVQIFSKGILIESKVISNPGGTSKSLEFSFVATAAMSPSMSILAFYLKETGEFVNDGLSLSVDGIFDNAVSIEFSSPKVQPGEKVDAIVKGEKDSVAFVLAVDKSVKLLKSGNDITQDMVRQELAGYDYGNYDNWRYMFICGWPSYFGGNDAQSVFSSAGVVVLTDGLVYSHRYSGYRSNPDILVRARMFSDSAPENSIASGKMKPAARTRKLFPENWLWDFKMIQDSGEVRIPLTAPDTITTWIASVFSVNPSKGLSVAAQPGTVTTFRDLFVSLELPSSIVRGEIFCFSASVFSYYQGETPVILKMHNSTDFKSVYPQKKNGKIIERKEELEYRHLIPLIKENQIVTKKFCFMPTVIGSIIIDVSAITNVAGLSDRVERKILVKPEGVPHTTTKPHLVELDQQGVWAQAVSMDFPTNTVTDSERVTINIAGNLLGPIFNNLEDLLRKPYGCGEQNMINFAPIMSLMDFFFTTNTITEEIREKAVNYMMIGYQKEILYEHGNTGGFSTFGNSKTEENASTWLTAFITKCFALAEQLDMQHSNILAIDTDIILRSSNWMISQQRRDGMFVENGKVFNKNLQGGSGNGIALTAYTVIALHESWLVLNSSYDSAMIKDIEKGMQKAILYLEMNLPRLEDPYDICITAYALNLVYSSAKDSAFDKMVSIAQEGSGMKYWSRPKQEKKEYYYWSRLNDAINIEMTAYALLTYSLRGIGTTDGLSIVRWLSKQKGENGGFISTQDTVIGVEALTSVAKKLHASEFVPMTIKVVNDKGITIETFQVTRENEMVLQRRDIPYQNGGKFQLNAKSSGTLSSSQSTVLVDVVFHYNVESETVSSGYEMEFEVLDQKKNYELLVRVKTSDGKAAGMTILAVEIPAGFSPNIDAIKTKTPYVSKVDVKEDILNLYFQTDVIDGSFKEVFVIMESAGGNLLNPKDKSLQIYDYYESDKQLTKLVQLKSSGICAKEPEVGICGEEAEPSRPQVIP